MPMIGLDCFVMRVPEGRTPASAAEQVSRDSAVSWAQPVGLYRTEAEPATHNDPLYLVQPTARAWRLADLHELATGRGMRVAVIDSGIEPGHPDLAGQLLVNRNFVMGRRAAAEMHGTGVAGIIAAKADNGLGIAGVAPQAHILGLRACWQSGNSPESPTVCDSFSLVKALYFAIEQKADVINLSLSGPEDRLIHQLIDIGLARGLAIVAAVDEGRPNGGFPASAHGVIAVSNTVLARSQGAVYTAPGKDVPTTEPGGRWFLVNGSSYAAANVSGLVALMRQRHRSPAWSLVSNGGVIDACASVLRAATGRECKCAASCVAVAQSDR
jgi:subtilisin family serine protease